MRWGRFERLWALMLSSRSLRVILWFRSRARTRLRQAILEVKKLPSLVSSKLTPSKLRSSWVTPEMESSL